MIQESTYQLPHLHQQSHAPFSMWSLAASEAADGMQQLSRLIKGTQQPTAADTAHTRSLQAYAFN